VRGFAACPRSPRQGRHDVAEREAVGLDEDGLAAAQTGTRIKVRGITRPRDRRPDDRPQLGETWAAVAVGRVGAPGLCVRPSVAIGVPLKGAVSSGPSRPRWGPRDREWRRRKPKPKRAETEAYSRGQRRCPAPQRAIRECLQSKSHRAPRVWPCATVLGVRSAPASGQDRDPPEVTALRKKIRGEVLTDEEAQLLARVSRRPEGGAPISQEQMTALLAERKRRGE
jgi:hypothetical protein